jgi:arylsulfatase A-like enzyme
MLARSRVRLFSLCLLLSCVTATSAAAQARAANRPNVVLIITDDMGWADLGSYGAPDVRTPHLDQLARDGVRFTDFYANAVLCTPTRAGLITGRYQQRYGIEAALPSEGANGGDGGLTATGYSLPQLLKRNGYVTGLVGKWHLGYKPQHSPGAHGFDYFFGLKSGYHDYYTHTGRDGRPDLWENDQPITRTGYSTDLITEQSVRFIQQHADKAFFIDVAYNAPHWPFQPPDQPSVARDSARFLTPADSATSTRAEYVAMVERVDRGVGELMRALDSLGIANNTIVIFTNDNGGEWLSNGGPLFNRKWTVWEGGIRVPTIMRWTGRIPAGRVSSQVGMTMDLTASILAATGTAVPAAARLEGMNLFPIAEGRAPEVERTLFWRTAVGQRTQKAVRRGDWKLVVDGTHMFVYNVRNDMGERTDMSQREPAIARSLRQLIAQWERDVDGEAKASSR